MLLHFNTFHFFNKAAIGISIHMHDSGQISVCGLEIELMKKEVHIKQLFDCSGNIQEFLKVIPNPIPICIVITGKGMLNKTLVSKDTRNDEYFNKLLPQAAKQEFHCQSYYLMNEKVSFSVMRHSQIKDLLQGFYNKKLNISALYLGNELLGTLAELLPKNNSIITGLGQELIFEENSLIGLRSVKNDDSAISLNTDGFHLTTAHQLSFVAGLQHFSPDPNMEASAIEEINHLKFHHRRKRIIRKYAMIGISISFIILTINSILFLNLNSELSHLQSEISVNERYLREADELTDDIEAKKSLLKKVNPNPGKISFYSDRIAAVLPPSIILNEMIVYPQESPNKKNEVASFNSTLILIKGLVSQNTQLYDFIRLLSDYEWIERVELTSLDKVAKGHDSEFNLKLMLK